LLVEKLSIVILKYVLNKITYNRYIDTHYFATNTKTRINVSEKACYVFMYENVGKEKLPTNHIKGRYYNHE